MRMAFLPVLVLVAAILGLPLLGAWLARLPLEIYLQVPLTAPSWDHLPLDTGVFLAACLLAGAILFLPLWFARPRDGRAANRGEGANGDLERMRPAQAEDQTDLGSAQSGDSGLGQHGGKRPGRFPTWGWAGLAAILVSPILSSGAWSRLGLSMLLLGLVLLLNADTERRTGSCLISKRPGFAAALLPAGALLGWLYHYLNLYLQLWHYPQAGSSLAFVLGETLVYATLLPALLALRQWLASFPQILSQVTRARPLDVSGGAESGWLLVGLASMALAGAPIWPDWIFPLTWLAPLLLALGLQRLRGRPDLLAGLARGDWSRVLLPALAALLLGTLLQAWDAVSGPVWQVSLPLIQAAPILGLPAPAYVGFLPLGLLGLWLADQLARPWHKRPLRRFPKFPFKVVVKH